MLTLTMTKRKEKKSTKRTNNDQENREKLHKALTMIKEIEENYTQH